MITLFQIDKSGNDLFERDYSVVLLLNKKEGYGINIPQKIKDDILSSLKKGELNINAPSDKAKKNRLRIRFHTAIIILLIEQAIKDLGYLEDVNIEVCNDIDGHFHEIKDMLFKHFTKLIPSLKPEDIISTRFQKPSTIDEIGRIFRANDTEKIKQYNKLRLDFGDLFKIIKKTMGHPHF